MYPIYSESVANFKAVSVPSSNTSDVRRGEKKGSNVYKQGLSVLPAITKNPAPKAPVAFKASSTAANPRKRRMIQQQMIQHMNQSHLSKIENTSESSNYRGTAASVPFYLQQGHSVMISALDTSSPLSLPHTQVLNRDALLLELESREESAKRNHLDIPKVSKTMKQFQVSYKGVKEMLNVTFKDFGSFHYIFECPEREDILLRFIHPNLPIKSYERPTGELIGYRRAVLENGYESYNKLKRLGIRVPKIYNAPLKDGYYIIEKIPHEAIPEQWKHIATTEMLSKESRQQLNQVKDILLLMKKNNELLVPDFKPHNVRFNHSNQLVVIDFCEDLSIPAFDRPLKDLLQEYINDWSGGNKIIAQYLAQGVLI